jgi:hypothetical protein
VTDSRVNATNYGDLLGATGVDLERPDCRLTPQRLLPRTGPPAIPSPSPPPPAAQTTALRSRPTGECARLLP